ncbi:hypothetical protein ACE3NQ_24520 [Paenibacillus terreus]|uniref:Uncharacterized protein n=1 Tax=Paenibacillus terreus TaxID=1387834 RepID=A0ABV5BED9_9BACL
MRKLVTLALVLALSALTACSDNSKAINDAKDAGNTAKKIPIIVWQYPTPGNLGSGFQEVEDALNAMLEKDVGARVKFESVGLNESTKKLLLP